MRQNWHFSHLIHLMLKSIHFWNSNFSLYEKKVLQLMSAVTSLETFGERYLVFIKWRSTKILLKMQDWIFKMEWPDTQNPSSTWVATKLCMYHDLFVLLQATTWSPYTALVHIFYCCGSAGSTVLPKAFWSPIKSVSLKLWISLLYF